MATSVPAAEVRARAQTRVRWELLANLIRKDLKVKYQGSTLGFLWSLANPLLLMVVYSLVFGVVFKNGQPYFAIYLMSGLLIWSAFQGAVQYACGSVVASSGLVKKVRFPTQVLPLSSVGFAAVHFVLQMLVLVAVMAIAQFDFLGWQLLLLIPATALAALFALGLGYLVAALNVRYRDTQHLVEVVMIAWFWLNPIIYDVSLIKTRLHHFYWAYFLNPMATVVTSYQRAIYKIPSFTAKNAATNLPELRPILTDTGYWFYLRNLGMGFLIAGALFWFGRRMFHRLSADFAEEL